MILLNSVLASTGPTPIVSSVVNGASYIMAPLPSNSYAALFGSNLATNDQTVIVSVADQLGNQSSPTVLYAGTEQVNVLVPAGTGTLQVTNRFGTSKPFPITFAAVSPGLFTVDIAGKIPAAQVVTAGANNTQIVQSVANCTGGTCAPVPIILDPANPACLILYGTGIRDAPACPTYR